LPVPPANGFLAILAAHRADVLWTARSFELDGRTRASTRVPTIASTADSSVSAAITAAMAVINLVVRQGAWALAPPGLMAH
jgi:hypothetical protein